MFQRRAARTLSRQPQQKHGAVDLATVLLGCEVVTYPSTRKVGKRDYRESKARP
jgi:hypothetical protein